MKIIFGRADASAARTAGSKTALTSKRAPRMLFSITPIGKPLLSIPGMVLFQTVSDAQRLRPRARRISAGSECTQFGQTQPGARLGSFCFSAFLRVSAFGL